MSEEIHPTAAEIAESIDRIARTPDGANLYVLLQRRVMRVIGVAEPGALQSDNGERLFAAKLIGFMAKGIHESGGRTSSTGSSSSSSEQPVVVPVGSPRDTTGGRRAGRAARIASIDIGGTSLTEPGSERTGET